MISQINDEVIPPDIRLKIIKYYKMCGRDDEAENEKQKLTGINFIDT